MSQMNSFRSKEGLKIAENLKEFVDRFDEAPEELNSLSNDVKFTSKTLEELSDSLKSPRSFQVVKEEWYADTQSHVDDCTSVFVEIKCLLAQYQSNESCAQKNGLSKRQRLRIVWSHNKITRFRARVQNLQNGFSFRLAVFQFSSNAIDRRLRDKEREQAKVLNRLQYERAILDLRMAYVKINDEDSAKHDQDDEIFGTGISPTTAAEKSDAASSIAFQLNVPPSPAGTSSLKASTSTLISPNEQMVDNWQRTTQKSGPSFINPVKSGSGLVAEDIGGDEATSDIDNPSEYQAVEPQVATEASEKQHPLQSAKQEGSNFMLEQLSTLTNLVQELSGRLGQQTSNQSGQVIEIPDTHEGNSSDDPARTTEICKFELAAYTDAEPETLESRSRIVHDIDSMNGSPIELRSNAVEIADIANSTLSGVEKVAAIEIANTVNDLDENGAAEITCEDGIESTSPTRFTDETCKDPSERSGAAARSSDTHGGIRNAEKGNRASLAQGLASEPCLELQRSSTRNTRDLKEKLPSSVSSRSSTPSTSPTNDSEISRKVLLFDTGHRDSILKSLKKKLFKREEDREANLSNRRGGPTFQCLKEPSDGPLVERLESWSIHCNETSRRLGQVDRAWRKARVQFMPVVSKNLSKELSDRESQQSLFDELADLPCSAREQIMDLLIKRWDFDSDLELDDNQCGWTLAAIQKRPSGATQRNLRALFVIIQRVWIKRDGDDAEVFGDQVILANQREPGAWYACWHIENERSDWEVARLTKIPMRQLDMAKMVRSGNNSTLHNLRNGEDAHIAKQIERLVYDQNARDEQFRWNVVYSAFDKSRKNQDSGNNYEILVIILEGKSKQNDERVESKRTKRNPKETAQHITTDDHLDNLFQDSVLFDRTGKPTDGQGHIVAFNNAALPPPLPPNTSLEEPGLKASEMAYTSDANHQKDDFITLDGILGNNNNSGADSKTGHSWPTGKRLGPAGDQSHHKEDEFVILNGMPGDDTDSAAIDNKQELLTLEDILGADSKRTGRTKSKRSKSRDTGVHFGAPDRYYSPPRSVSSSLRYSRSHERSRPTSNSDSDDVRYGYDYSPSRSSGTRKSSRRSASNSHSQPFHASSSRSKKKQAMSQESDKVLSEILDKWVPMGSEAMDMGPVEANPWTAESDESDVAY